MPAAARKIALTDRSLKALKPDPDGRRQIVWDALMPGHAVRISALGKRSFYAVKRRVGEVQPTWHYLGSYPVMSLSEARTAAREALSALLSGEHPKRLAEAKRQAAEAAAREAEASSFGEISKAFARHQLPDMKPSSARLYQLYLDRWCSALGARQVTEIRRSEITAVIRDISTNSGKSSAIGALSVVRRLFNWVINNDNDLIKINPASSISVKDLIGSTKPRSRALKDAELAAVWAATAAVGEPFLVIYRLLMLTGLRLNEVAGCRWEELDLEAGTLSIPAERSKNGLPMLVPMPPSAVALFAAVKRCSGPFIFSSTAGRRPVQAFSRGKRRLDAALAAQGATVEDFVIHDFRRVVRTGLSQLQVVGEVAEACLGHKKKGIESTYNMYEYLDEKRAALRQWEAHLLAIVVPSPVDEGGNVVQLAAAR
jgi:integrase